MKDKTIDDQMRPDFRRFLACYAELSPKELRVIEQRFIQHMSLEDIGKTMEVTNERVRQIIQNIQRKIAVKSKLK